MKFSHLILYQKQHMLFHCSLFFDSKTPTPPFFLNHKTPFLMACATTRPTFSFPISTSKTPKPHFIFTKTHLKSHHFLPFHQTPLKIVPRSIDVSKEDNPPPPPPPPPTETDDLDLPTPYEPESFDKRRLEEKFAVLNTGIYECRSCGYNYDESVGDPSYPIAPGFQFNKLPEDWRCPTCGAAQSFFESKSVEIAGFAENQQFGLGANTLTAGQKGVLIYGSLLFFFALFLSGYFLQ